MSSVAEIERETVAPTSIAAGTKYVGLEHITPDGSFAGVTSVSDGELKSTKFRFTREHILYGKLRPYLSKIARPDFEGVCSTDILPIRTKGRLSRDYLTHFLRQPAMVDLATRRSTGANLPRLSPQALAEFAIVYPEDESEQKRIATVLDKADTIRRKREQAIALTEDLRRSTFLSMVGPSAPGYQGWPHYRIERLAASGKGTIRSGPFGSTLRHSEFVDSGIAVLGIDNAVSNRFEWIERRYIRPEKYDTLKQYTVYPGDVLITIMGTTGRSAVVPMDIPTAITTKHLATITVDRDLVEPEFLSHAIHVHPDVLRQIEAKNRGAIMEGLNLGIIRSLELAVPPLEVQRRFVDVLTKVRSIQTKMRSGYFSALLASISQLAFRGEL